MSDTHITEAEQLAVPDWMHQLASQIVLGNHGVGNAGVLIHRAFQMQANEAEQIARVGMALCQSALGGKRCPCVESGVFGCAEEYPGAQAKVAIAAVINAGAA